MIGNPEAIDDAIKQLTKEGLVLKVINKMQDYLSSEIRFSEDKKWAWIGQLLLESATITR